MNATQSNEFAKGWIMWCTLYSAEQCTNLDMLFGFNAAAVTNERSGMRPTSSEVAANDIGGLVEYLKSKGWYDIAMERTCIETHGLVGVETHGPADADTWRDDVNA